MNAARSPTPDVPWWQDAVVYQIYPLSFADDNGDGIGDLAGVCRRLDYLAWLGVDAVWLSSICRSPMRDGGYDVSDYLDVNPVLGDLATFDRLVEEVHRRGLRLLLDWVPNHTSDQHPWFAESRSGRDSPKRDWYFWRDGSPEHPPNNWRAFRDGSAWSTDERTGQMYLHLFLPEQPDLNWNNPQVAAAMHDTMRFWLDRGVDGFRIDVVHCLGKADELRSRGESPDVIADVEEVRVHDEDLTHDLIRGFHSVVDEYPGERVLVGEVILRRTALIRHYYGQGDELHLAFNFLSLDAPWDADAWRDLLERVPKELGADRWPTWVLSNHDIARHRTRYGGSLERARAAAVLLLTARGTPFLYQGEELGLDDAAVPAERQVDRLGRDGSRAPIPWSAEDGYGWLGVPPPLPFPPEAPERNVEVLAADRHSILHLYRDLLQARRRSAALRRGSWEELPTPPGVLGYSRSYEPLEHRRDQRLVLVNFGAEPVFVPVPDPVSRTGAVTGTREGAETGVDGWRVEVCSRAATAGQLFSGELAPDHAVLLAPVERDGRYWRTL